MKKIKTCCIYRNTVFANWEKYEVSWNICLVFIIDFQSCIPGSFDTVTSFHKGFRSERAAAGLGPSGLKHRNKVKDSWIQFFFFKISNEACSLMPRDINCNQTKQILTIWMLEPDSNHHTFHQSTLCGVVVESKAGENSNELIHQNT